MKIKHIIKNILLEKFISSNVQIGYHRTRSLDTIKSIFQNGYKIGYGDMYGSGVYNTLELDSQLNDVMDETYGHYIIKNRIKINNRCLIFDIKYRKQVYGNNVTLVDQFKLLTDKYTNEDIKYLQSLDNEINKGIVYTSDIAQSFIDSPTFKKLYITGKLWQIEFTGRNDGVVIVQYSNKIVTPLSWNSTLHSPNVLDYKEWQKEEINKNILNPIPYISDKTPIQIKKYIRDINSSHVIDEKDIDKIKDKNGKYVFINKEKNYYIIATYKDNKLNGKYIKIKQDGTPVYILNYKNGKLDGKCYYYDYGELYYIIDYKDGKEISTTYYKNGQKTHTNMKLSNNHIKIIDYDEDGNKYMETEYLKDNNGIRKDGKEIEYYPNGKIQRITIYKNNKRDGKEKEYDENGKLISTYEYKDDKLNGKSIDYDEDGNILMCEIYKDGKFIKKCDGD